LFLCFILTLFLMSCGAGSVRKPAKPVQAVEPIPPPLETVRRLAEGNKAADRPSAYRTDPARKADVNFSEGISFALLRRGKCLDMFTYT
jgi:hypothetical protein